MSNTVREKAADVAKELSSAVEQIQKTLLASGAVHSADTFTGTLPEQRVHRLLLSPVGPVVHVDIRVRKIREGASPEDAAAKIDVLELMRKVLQQDQLFSYPRSADFDDGKAWMARRLDRWIEDAIAMYTNDIEEGSL